MAAPPPRLAFVALAGACMATGFAVGCRVPLLPGMDGLSFACTDNADCDADHVCDPAVGTCVLPGDVRTVTPADGGPSGGDGGPADGGLPDAARPDAGRRDGGRNNRPPVIPEVAEQTFAEGSTGTSLNVTIIDLEDDPVMLEAVPGSERLSITVTPVPLTVGQFRLDLVGAPHAFGRIRVTLQASDGFNVSSRPFFVFITPVNDPPTLALFTPPPAREDQGAVAVPFFVFNASPGEGEKDAQHLAYALRLVESGSLSFAAAPTLDAAGTLRFTTAPNAFGTFRVAVDATDDGTPPLTTTAEATLVVEPVNDAPVLALSAMPQPSYVNSPQSHFRGRVQLDVSDLDGDQVQLAPTAVVPGSGTCVVDIITATLSLEPAPGVTGQVACQVTAVDVPSPGLMALSSSLQVVFDVLPPLRSCYAITTDSQLTALGVGTTSGPYMVDTDGASGPTLPGEVLCEMASPLGGTGWTLAFKALDTSAEAEFDHAFWTDPNLRLSATPRLAVDTTDKYTPFNTLPFSEVLVVLVDGTGVLGERLMKVGGTSLLESFQDGWSLQEASTVGVRDPSGWQLAAALVDPLPSGCGQQGLNAGSAAGGRVRLGVVAADPAGTCATPLAFVGVGADQEICAGRRVGAAVCATAGTVLAGTGARVYVRESALRTRTPRPSCMQHRLAGATANGLYPLRTPGYPGYVARCEQTLLGGGWTLLASQGGEGAVDGPAMLAGGALGDPFLVDDHLSPSIARVAVDDYLFTGGSPSETGPHAWYQGAGLGMPLGLRLVDYATSQCAATQPIGFSLTSGIMNGALVCSRTLYLSPLDQSGSATTCTSSKPALGPAWSTGADTDGCPMTGPGEHAFTSPSSALANPNIFAVGARAMWGRETDFTAFAPEATCQAHRDLGRTLSGTYRLLDRLAHCRMLGTEGWMRVAHVDMNNQAVCPGTWQATTRPRGCARSAVGATGLIRTATFPVGMAYTQLRGHIRAFQVGTLDAFNHGGTPDTTGNYVDGVSITTQVAGQHTHLYTYAMSLRDLDDAVSCPCHPNAAQPPADVGSAFACDTGNPTSGTVLATRVFVDNELFDGLRGSICAPTADPAEFSVSFAQTSAPVDVRLMGDEDSTNEDVIVTRLELLVR